MISRIKKGLLALHRDEKGADMIEYILVVAAIALPLLAVVIWFWKDISRWAGDLWESAKGQKGVDPEDLPTD
jgi:Flp pilus assembly pilin Flp